MTAFDRLHPAIQHHIVNSLGWRQLRPTQDDAISPILEQYHVLILAPTAGGKTEAALFPVFSRMITEKWNAVSVLYVCPIKALLNNLLFRLERYAGFVGRRVALWHGDVPESTRRAIRSDPPDVLLTTPESIEAMLISTRTDRKTFFAGLQVVIIDELHAFAGDDRGWHLLMVLERLNRLSGRTLQRIGLSATIGNADQLLEWLARDLDPGKTLIGGKSVASSEANVQIDHVGSLENAAYVLSRLYRGEKRLVFADSRSKVEALAVGLRQHGVRTFVSHSSLSQDERRQAEEAFATESNCIIVATSTLELGLDVGDLDRVIQIDAPSTVASFLQRMGRTGRRPGAVRNCLFLATTDESFLFSAALVRLWLDGFIEPVEPPPSPWHLFAQQVMALCLQESGTTKQDWKRWIGSLPLFKSADAATFEEILDFMTARHIIEEDEGVLWLGATGEKLFGRRHFSDIVTSFTAPMLINVRYGRSDLGQIDPVTLKTRSSGPPVFVLAGRSWVAKHVDWPARLCWVEAVDQPGHSRWMGSSRAARFEICQAISRIIAEGLPAKHLSRRGAETLTRLQEDMAWCRPGATAMMHEKDDACSWWTFAGARANSILAAGLAGMGHAVRSCDNFRILLEVRSPARFSESIQAFPDVASVELPIPDRLISELKFNECLPEAIASRIISGRQSDTTGAQHVVGMPIVTAPSAKGINRR